MDLFLYLNAGFINEWNTATFKRHLSIRMIFNTLKFISDWDVIFKNVSVFQTEYYIINRRMCKDQDVNTLY